MAVSCLGTGWGRGAGHWGLQAGWVQQGISCVKTKEGQGPLFLDCAFGQLLSADVNSPLAEYPEEVEVVDRLQGWIHLLVLDSAVVPMLGVRPLQSVINRTALCTQQGHGPSRQCSQPLISPRPFQKNHKNSTCSFSIIWHFKRD